MMKNLVKALAAMSILAVMAVGMTGCFGNNGAKEDQKTTTPSK
jgi:hypothetical protein